MNRTFKTFLLWLLIALLPFHAVAGSLGMPCAPVHHQAPAPSSVSAPHHEVVADEHAHHGGEHASHTAELSSDTEPSVSDVEKQSHGSCSACSSFCLGAVAPPSTDLAVPAFDGSDAAVTWPAAFLVGFIQDGPQRPPRHQSA